MAEEKAKSAKIPGKSSLNLFLVVLLVIGSFAVGYLFNRVRELEKGSPAVGGAKVADNRPSNNNQPQAPEAGDVAPVTDQDHIKGSKDAKIVLIEYSDLECPFCQRFHSTAQQVVDEYDGKVAWVYRHFPLDTLHPQARPAAVASECVANLAGNDAFWSFIDEIFSTTDTSILSESSLASIAAGLGVNSSDYQNCLGTNAAKSSVENQYQSGVKAGVTGTPGNILLNTETGDTELIPGALPLSQMKSAIDKML